MSDNEDNYGVETIDITTNDDSTIYCAQRRQGGSLDFVDFIRQRREIIDLSLQKSPEVVCNGEKKFKTVCNDLCDESDRMYNQASNRNHQSLSSSNLSSGHATSLPPRRIVQVSKYRSSPYGDNSVRFSVRAEETKYYDAIIRLANIDEHMYSISKFWGIRLKGEVKLKHMSSTLSAESFLETIIQGCRTSIFFFHTMSEFFLGKYTSKIRMEEMKENVIRAFHGAGSAKQLHLCELLFFPSLYKSHWFLFVVDLRDQKFVFLDSIFGKDSAYHQEAVNLLISNFIDMWLICGLKKKDFDNFRIIFPRVPMQDNGDDCGIYIMKFMELWTPRNQLFSSFSKQDIPNIRGQLANQLMFCSYNTCEDSKSLVFQFNPRVHSKYANQM